MSTYLIKMTMEINSKDQITDEQKELFVALSKGLFRACDGFCDEILKCQTFGDLKRILCVYNESVFEKLGGDLDDDDDDRINELESDVENLEKEISMYQKILGNTMIDSWKMEIYVENKDKFTPLQLQQIFQASIASGMNEKTH